MINKPMASIAAIFAPLARPFSIPWKDYRFGSGTQTRTTRTPGKQQPAGTKLARAAEEHKLDGNRGGIVSQAFRNDKINRNLARFANQ